MTYLLSKIDSLKEVSTYLKDPQSTLVIFDVDYVLTHPNDPAYQFPNFNRYIEFVRKTYARLSPIEKDLFSSFMVLIENQSILIEKNSPEFVSYLQNSGYKTIALTASLTSIVNDISLTKRRVQRLNELGFDFSSSFQDCLETTFSEFEPNIKAYPKFCQGILFSNGENKAIMKGEVLKAFLRKNQFSPKHLFIIDDRQVNLDAIAKTFEDDNIHIHGFCYQGGLRFPSKQLDKEEFENKWHLLSKKVKKINIDSIES